MSEGQPVSSHALAELLQDAERVLSAGEITTRRVSELRSTLDRVESHTPGGAPLHAQLDNVRKWLDALDRPADHQRFGGEAHLRGYVLTQLRLALGALEDYRRAMT